MIKHCFVLALAIMAAAQEDGNPHGWDRQRRCDNFDYDPPCGICEGIGGIPWGDKNDEITLTKCEPVSDPADLPIDVQTDYPKLPH